MGQSKLIDLQQPIAIDIFLTENLPIARTIAYNKTKKNRRDPKSLLYCIGRRQNKKPQVEICSLTLIFFNENQFHEAKFNNY